MNTHAEKSQDVIQIAKTAQGTDTGNAATQALRGIGGKGAQTDPPIVGYRPIFEIRNFDLPPTVDIEALMQWANAFAEYVQRVSSGGQWPFYEFRSAQ